METRSVHHIPRILWGVFIALLALGAGLRLFDLTDQPIDFHSTRQLRGAIVARGIYYQMLPSADESTRQLTQSFWSSTGQYEPSILEFVTASTYLALGKEVFWVARIYNTLLWLLGGLGLFGLARRIARKTLEGGSPGLSARSPAMDTMYPSTDTLGVPTHNSPFAIRNSPSASSASSASSAVIAWISACLALAYYLALPFSAQASRSFQPDPGMVVWLVLSAYSLYRWAETGSWKWTLISGLFAGLAVLTKAVSFYPVAATLLAMILYRSAGTPKGAKGSSPDAKGRESRPFYLPLLNALRSAQAWCMALLMVAPTAFY